MIWWRALQRKGVVGVVAYVELLVICLWTLGAGRGRSMQGGQDPQQATVHKVQHSRRSECPKKILSIL